MTRAPEALLAPRRLLLTHLDIDPDTSRSQDLEPAEVGIVGDSAHRGGYHCGSDRVDGDDYSVRESSRDRNGLTLDAAALDIGKFTYRSPTGKVHNLPSFSRWLVGECERGAPDTLDIREVIYSPDGVTVRRWDRLRKRSSGDRSHLGHTHISYFRDAIKARRDQSPLFRRYLATIGLLGGTMALDKNDMEFFIKWDGLTNPYPDRATNPKMAFDSFVRNVAGDTYATKLAVSELGKQLAAATAELGKRVDQVAAKVAAPAPVTVDPAALAAALTRPEFLAALARAVNDDAARRLAG